MYRVLGSRDLPVDARGVFIKENKAHFSNIVRVAQGVCDRAHRDRSGELHWISEGARRYGRKRDRRQFQLIGNTERFAITTRKCFRFPAFASSPYRPDGVNDVTSGKIAADGGDGS